MISGRAAASATDVGDSSSSVDDVFGFTGGGVEDTLPFFISDDGDEARFLTEDDSLGLDADDDPFLEREVLDDMTARRKGR